MTANDCYERVVDRAIHLFTTQPSTLPADVEPWHVDVARLVFLERHGTWDGLGTYIHNGYGDLLPVLRDTARRWGEDEIAELLTRAMAAFPTPYPTDRAERHAVWPEPPAGAFDALPPEVRPEPGSFAWQMRGVEHIEEGQEVLEGLEARLDVRIAAGARG